MSATKIKLKFSVIAILMSELTENAMWAIYLAGLGKDMPDQVTKADLMKIIALLCKKLDWLEDDEEPPMESNTKEEETIEPTEEDLQKLPNKSETFYLDKTLKSEVLDVNSDKSDQSIESHGPSENCETILSETKILCDEDQVETSKQVDVPTRDMPFNCTLCDQRFSKENYLSAHFYMKHGDMSIDAGTHAGEKPFNCSQCDKKFGKLQHIRSTK